MDQEAISQELTARTKRYTKAEQVIEEEAGPIRDLVIAGLKLGMPPGELVRLSPWSPAYVRRIAREAGIEAAGRYKNHAERLKGQ